MKDNLEYFEALAKEDWNREIAKMDRFRDMIEPFLVSIGLLTAGCAYVVTLAPNLSDLCVRVTVYVPAFVSYTLAFVALIMFCLMIRPRQYAYPPSSDDMSKYKSDLLENGLEVDYVNEEIVKTMILNYSKGAAENFDHNLKKTRYQIFCIMLLVASGFFLMFSIGVATVLQDRDEPKVVSPGDTN